MQSIFALSQFQKNLILLFTDTKLGAKHKKTCEFHLCYWDHVCQVNEWCLVDCFHCEFKVSTQIIVCNYCTAKCKFSACGRLLMIV